MNKRSFLQFTPLQTHIPLDWRLFMKFLLLRCFRSPMALPCEFARAWGRTSPGTNVVRAIGMAGLLILGTNNTPVSAASYTFQGLGNPPAGEIAATSATGVNDDGSVVVGSYLILGPTEVYWEAFRWTSGGGMVGMGFLPGASGYSEATGVSADGSTIVGGSDSAAPGSEAFRWTNDTGMVGLGDLPGGGVSSHAFGVSADGSVVVGSGKSADFDLGQTSGIEAFRWTIGGGMVGLGYLPDKTYGSEARAVSADGLVVVGSSESSTAREAFRWTDGGGMVGLGDLPGGSLQSIAHDVSADGSVVVGTGNTASGNEAFRWTSGGGMFGLGQLPGGGDSEAKGVSADGSVVVGFSWSSAGLTPEAFYWSESGGMVNLRELLIDNGVAGLSGWKLFDASAVSADGRTIVGVGENPDGLIEPWIATVPEPGTAVLAVLSALGLLTGRHSLRKHLKGER